MMDHVGSLLKRSRPILLFEGLKEKGSIVIVPSSALDTMNLGAIGGLASLAKSNDTLANG